MWPFSKKSRLKPHAKYAVKYTVKTLESKGLLSLYAGGPVLEKEVPIDQLHLFGIVDKSFDTDFESVINEELRGQQENLMKGLEAFFVAVPLQDLLTKISIPLSRGWSTGRFVKYLPHYSKIWGRKYRQDNFPIYAEPLKEELSQMISHASVVIEKIRQDTEEDYRHFPQLIISIAALEAEAEGYKPNPSWKKLQEFFSERQKHIIHDAISLLGNTPKERLDMIPFVSRAEVYLDELNKLVSAN